MQTAATRTPLLAARGMGQPRRQHHTVRGGLHTARAEPFNEGAAQVRRLVDRDRKELNLDDLEATFAEDPTASSSGPSTPRNAAEADGDRRAAPAPPPPSTTAGAVSPFQATSSASDKTPVSPFGPPSSSSGGTSNPFASAGAAPKRPFTEPAGLSPNMPTPQKDSAPWWKSITTTQIVIALSFTTIITLMISTFFFVLSTGAIRFNE